MGSEYINQKVRDSLEEQLIGDFNPANLRRLKMATCVLVEGVLPLNRELLGDETSAHLEMLKRHVNGETAEDFYALREHYIAYIMCSQRDEGLRSAATMQAAS